MLVGLISDTHGLLRPEVAEVLSGVSIILHAGDVGGAWILEELRRIAPVHAVHGNVDLAGPGLGAAVDIEIEGVHLHVSHGHELGSPSPEKLLARYAADVIVYGHTHRALVERAGTRLVVNPGAAGPRRFNLQPSVAKLSIERGTLDAELVWLP